MVGFTSPVSPSAPSLSRSTPQSAFIHFSFLTSPMRTIKTPSKQPAVFRQRGTPRYSVSMKRISNSATCRCRELVIEPPVQAWYLSLNDCVLFVIVIVLSIPKGTPEISAPTLPVILMVREGSVRLASRVQKWQEYEGATQEVL